MLALLGWAARCRDLAGLRGRAWRERRAHPRARPSEATPPLTLATIHGTKGLEWDHVACIGHDEGTFPSGRALREADDPRRVLEEERRLAYVAWTRARKTLTIVYDPGAPSTFVLEAFDPRSWPEHVTPPCASGYHRPMSTTAKILIAGESWVTHSIHQKGFDSFTTTAYNEGVGPLRDALEAGGFEVDYLPNHVAAHRLPRQRRGPGRLRRGDPQRHRQQHPAAAPRDLRALGAATRPRWRPSATTSRPAAAW